MCVPSCRKRFTPCENVWFVDACDLSESTARGRKPRQQRSSHVSPSISPMVLERTSTLPPPSLYRYFNFTKAKMPSLYAAAITAATSICVIPLLVAAIILLAIHLPRPRTKATPRLVQPQLQSRLLALPFELRTQTWLLILPYEITLSKQDPLLRIPAIRLTCRQALREVLPIFCSRTKFRFDIEDCDGAFTCRGRARLKSLNEAAEGYVRGHEIGVRFSGKKKWKNVVIWAEEVHASGHWLLLRAPFGTDEAVIASTMEITQRLRALPWSNVELILGLLPTASDPAWA